MVKICQKLKILSGNGGIMLEELKKHRLEEKLSPLIKKEENLKKELLT